MTSAPVYHAVLADAQARTVRFDADARSRLTPRQMRTLIPGPLPADVRAWVETTLVERLGEPDARCPRPFRSASGTATRLLLDVEVMLAGAVAAARERLGFTVEGR